MPYIPGIDIGLIALGDGGPFGGVITCQIGTKSATVRVVSGGGGGYEAAGLVREGLVRGGCRGYPLVNYKQAIDINKNNIRVSEIEPRDVIQVYVSKIHVIKYQSATLVSRLSRTVRDVFGRDPISEVGG